MKKVFLGKAFSMLELLSYGVGMYLIGRGFGIVGYVITWATMLFGMVLHKLSGDDE